MEAPFRTLGDNAFQRRDIGTAIQMYRQSVDSEEEGMLYTYINLAAALCKADAISPAEITSLLIKALACRDFDEKYFTSSIKELCFELIILGAYEESSAILTLSGLRKKIPVAESHFIFIPGFPRCGTTTVAKALESSGEAIGSISPEPHNRLMGLGLTEGEERKIVGNSFWAPANTESRDQVFIEKSTHWLLNIFYTRKMLSFSENASFIVCKRSPVDRAVSAYNYSRDKGMPLSLEDAIKKDSQLIKALGRINTLFNDKKAFECYLTNLGKEGIPLPILYPSSIMTKIKSLVPSTLAREMSFFDIDTKELSGKAIDNHLSGVIQSVSEGRQNYSLYRTDESERNIYTIREHLSEL